MEIFVITHKKVDMIPKDGIYRFIQVGAEGKEHFEQITDDSGDNISNKNPNYCELTGMYWLWKHEKTDIIGLCHYRRFFTNRLGYINKILFGINTNILKEKTIRRILGKYDVILTRSEHFNSIPIKARYKKSHNLRDLNVIEDIIKEKYPDYIDAYNTVMNGVVFNYANMLICRKEVFDAYSSWLFDILFELEKRIDISGYNQYQSRIFGFISERIMRVWFIKNKMRIKELPIINTDDPCFIKWQIRRSRQKKLKRQGTK